MHSFRTGLIAAILFFFIFGNKAVAAEDETAAEKWKPSPTGAAIRSLVFPGWGQAYNRRPLKSVVYGGIQEGLIYSIYLQHKQYLYYDRLGEDREAGFYKNDRNRLTWYLAGATILSVMDAFVDAHLYGFDVSDQLSFVKQNKGVMGSGVILTISWRMY